MINNKYINGVYLLILMVSGILIYSNTLHAPFLFDDIPYIINDSGVHMVHFNVETLETAALKSRPQHRIISNISFALNYYFGRLSTRKPWILRCVGFAPNY